MGGLQDAFEDVEICRLTADDLDLDPDMIGMQASPTRILDVSSPTAEKKNLVLKGSPRKVVEEIFSRFGDRIIGAIGKDIITQDHDHA